MTKSSASENRRTGDLGHRSLDGGQSPGGADRTETAGVLQTVDNIKMNSSRTEQGSVTSTTPETRNSQNRSDSEPANSSSVSANIDFERRPRDQAPFKAPVGQWPDFKDRASSDGKGSDEYGRTDNRSSANSGQSSSEPREEKMSPDGLQYVDSKSSSTATPNKLALVTGAADARTHDSESGSQDNDVERNRIGGNRHGNVFAPLPDTVNILKDNSTAELGDQKLGDKTADEVRSKVDNTSAGNSSSYDNETVVGFGEKKTSASGTVGGNSSVVVGGSGGSADGVSDTKSSRGSDTQTKTGSSTLKDEDTSTDQSAPVPDTGKSRGQGEEGTGMMGSGSKRRLSGANIRPRVSSNDRVLEHTLATDNAQQEISVNSEDRVRPQFKVTVSILVIIIVIRTESD